MYKITSLCVAGFVLVSCNTTSLDSSRETTQSADVPVVVDQRLIDEPSLNFQAYHKTARLSTRAEMQFQIQEHKQLQGKLAKLSPIPIPVYGTKPAISLEEADRRYRVFVKDEANNPLLPLFQQRYARFILTEYAMLETTNWPLLAYYADQMITSQSFDHTTITRALVNLHNHLPANQFNSLRTRAIVGASARLQVENQAILAIERMISKAEQGSTEGKPNPMDKLMLDGNRRLIEKFKDEALARQIGTLNRLAAD